MSDEPDSSEVFEEPFPSVEDLRPYAGQVVAFDRQGRIQLAAASWAELMSKLSDDAANSLTVLYLPPVRVIA